MASYKEEAAWQRMFLVHRAAPKQNLSGDLLKTSNIVGPGSFLDGFLKEYAKQPPIEERFRAAFFGEKPEVSEDKPLEVKEVEKNEQPMVSVIFEALKATSMFKSLETIWWDLTVPSIDESRKGPSFEERMKKNEMKEKEAEKPTSQQLVSA
jgi:hypothetical protein